MFSYCENNPVNRSDPSGMIFGTISGAIIGGAEGALSAYLNGDDIISGAVTGAANGAACGFIADTGFLTGGVAILACGFIGVVCEVANQTANGNTLQTMDYGSAALSAAFSALSFGMSKGVEKLMENTSKLAINLVTTVRSTSTALLGVGASNIYTQNRNKEKRSIELEHWKRMTDHYRSQVVR